MPRLREHRAPDGAAWAVEAEHPDARHLLPLRPSSRRSCCSPRTRPTPSACGAWPTPTPYVKDAFHRRVIDGDERAVNPTRSGTKVGAWSSWQVSAGQHIQLDLVLAQRDSPTPSPAAEVVVRDRARREADDLLRRPAARGRPRGPADPAPGPGRHDLEQAVLPLRRRALAGWRSARRRRRRATVAATATGGISRPPTSSPCRTPGSTPGSPPGIWPITAPPWRWSMSISPRTRSS